MSWTANIQGSYGANTMTVSWTAPSSIPNTYTVTAQPGGLTASVDGSATSATLTTSITGVAYNVSIVANYTGSTQTATATLVSPPAALAVPMTTDVAPWLWYDAADPTTLRSNASGALTELYNKGTSAGASNANASITSPTTYGTEALNARSLISATRIDTPSISALSTQSFAVFTVSKPTVNGIASIVDGANHLAVGFYNATQIYVGISGVGNSYSLLTIPDDARNEMKLYSIIASATGANSSISINGNVVPITGNLISLSSGTPISSYQNLSGSSTTASSRGMHNIVFGETIVYMGEITTTQRMQIEGYLAWKWGLQANLPATHPFSATNMAATMALYNRPRLYASTFASSITAGPRGQVFDSTGNLWVALNEDGVYKISSTGSITKYLTGVVSSHIAKDASDNIYATHFYNNYVSKITPSGNVTTHINSSFPHGIAIDTSNNYVYVFQADGVWKISRYSLSTGAYQTQFSITTNQYLSDMLIDNNGDIIAINISANRLERYNKTTGALTVIAGSGSASRIDGFGTEASFISPRGLAMDAQGNYYVADTDAHAIRRVSPSGMVVTIAGAGGAFNVNDIDVASRFNRPFGISIHPTTGYIYVSDYSNNAIRKLALGTLNQVGSYASVTSTYQSASDEYGNLYVGSYGGKTITKISSSGILSTFVGTGAGGSTNGAGTVATFDSANGVIRDELGNFYVAEHAGNRIRKVSPAGLVTTFVSIPSPLGLTMGPDGNIYVATHGNHTIEQVTRAGTISTYAGASGQSGVSDNVPRLSARFNVIGHMAFDSNGVMYVAEINGHKIRKIENSIVSTFAGNGTGATQDGTGTGARLDHPHGIAIDANNNLYISEWVGSSVRKITPSAVVSTIASGIGLCSYCQIDSAQNLWVSNTGNNSVRHIAINAVPTGSVSIIGSMTQGQTITANTSTLADSDGFGTFSYAWSSSPTADGVYTTIAGATGASLTLAEAQVGRFIRVVVSYTDGRGSAEAVSAVSVGSVANVNDPATGLAISGTLESDLTVSANLANLSDPDGIVLPYTYQWASSSLPSSEFTDISGATGSTYTLTAAEIGKYIRLTVSYTNSYNQPDSAVATSETTVISGNTPVSGSLDISGSLLEDEVVYAIANLVDPDGLGPLTYIWSSSSDTQNGVFRVDASGVDLSGITLSFGQTSRFLRVEVRYVDSKGVAEHMISTVVGPIIAHGPPDAPSVNATPGETSISLTITPPVNTGGRPITGYEVRDELGNFIVAVDTSDSSVVIPNLVPGVARRFTVVALNDRGSGAGTLSASVSPLAPSIASIESGAVPEVVAVPVVVAGIPAVVQKLTPAVEADGSKTVVFAPEPTKAAVAIANLPAEVEKVVVATAPPQNGYTTLKISAFDNAGSNLSDFAANPLAITLDIPGYTAETLLVRTFQEIGGPVSDTLFATRNENGSYTMTLTHLTYIRVSENVPCFVAGTKILTAAGYKAVEDIVDGELLATADGRALPCKLYITELDETTKENAPYLIPANTFGPRCPVRDLTLSPLHAIQIRRGVWQIPKAAATIYAGVRQLPVGAACTYYHLEMPNYLTDNIVADGTIVESYGARQLAGRRVEYRFSSAVGGFTRTVTEARRATAKRA
jgi:sugar lactone lactonase YvrE